MSVYHFAATCDLDLFCKRLQCIFRRLINQSTLCLSLSLFFIFSPKRLAPVEEPTTAAGDLARLSNNRFLKGGQGNSRDPVIFLKNQCFHLGLFLLWEYVGGCFTKRWDTTKLKCIQQLKLTDIQHYYCYYYNK